MGCSEPILRHCCIKDVKAMLGSPASNRLHRSKSVDALVARRQHLANEVRSLQHSELPSSFVADSSVLHSSLPRIVAPGVSEASLRRVELWAQLVSEHTELVARAMDLDRVTADAIYESQALSDASRIAMLQKHGLSVPDHLTGGVHLSSSLACYGSSHVDSSYPAGLKAHASRRSSVSEHSHSMLGYANHSGAFGAFPELLQPPSSFIMPHRSLRAEQLAAWDVGRSLDNSYSGLGPQVEPLRPAIYSAETPRRRQRPEVASRLPTSPFRPVLPSRAEPCYAADSPRQHSPYRQSALGNTSSLPGGGIAEIRARRERIAHEAHRIQDSLATSWKSPHWHLDLH